MPTKNQNKKPEHIVHELNGVLYSTFDGGLNWIADYGNLSRPHMSEENLEELECRKAFSQLMGTTYVVFRTGWIRTNKMCGGN